MGELLYGNFGRSSPQSPAKIEPVKAPESLKDVGPFFVAMWESLGEAELNQPRAMALSKMIFRGLQYGLFEKRHPEIPKDEMLARKILFIGETKLTLGINMSEPEVQIYEDALTKFPGGPYYIEPNVKTL